MLSYSSLCKNKEVLAKNGGGKLGKKCVSVFVLVEVIVALQHDTPLHHCIWVGKSICLSFDHPQVHMLGPPWGNCRVKLMLINATINYQSGRFVNLWGVRTGNVGQEYTILC